MKYAAVNLAEFKADDAGNGGFEGYASVFGVRDDGGDVVMPGAFAETIPDFTTRGFIGLGHDWSGLPIGYVKDAYEDTRGLYITTEYHSTATAQEARRVAQERIAAGKGVYLSIGYSVSPDGSEYSADGSTRMLKSLKLYEVSQVNIPMLKVAELTGVKAAEQGESAISMAREFAERLRAIDALRKKEGRTLSEQNRKKLADLLEQLQGVSAVIDDLLKATEPKGKDGLRLFTEYQSIIARINGVTHAHVA